ncbi:GntR family transcriptional regulator [Enteractinococcus fodinae]|nr:GntR family transcriptional regulator [Enteractinococcus fodinae]
MPRSESSPIVRPHRSLTQQVMDYVRTSVMNGQMQPGELYSVYQLAEELEISRSPVRDGLLRLEEAGMIRFSRNRGFQVIPTTPADIAEIFSIRIALEVPAARRAALSEADESARLAELRIEMQQAAADDDEERFFRADQELHNVILVTGGARRARDIVERLRLNTRLLTPSTVGLYRGFDTIVDEHDPIIDAITRGDDRAAAEAMQSHLVLTGRLLVKQALAQTGDSEDPDELWERLTAGYLH